MPACNLIGPTNNAAARKFIRIEHKAADWTYRQFTDGSACLFKQGQDPILLPDPEVQFEALPPDSLQAIHEGLTILVDAYESRTHFDS